MPHSGARSGRASANVDKARAIAAQPRPHASIRNMKAGVKINPPTVAPFNAVASAHGWALSPTKAAIEALPVRAQPNPVMTAAAHA